MILCVKNHKAESYYFCQKCANDKKPLNLIFTCKDCNKKMNQEHRGHSTEVKRVTQGYFSKLYQQLKQKVRQQMVKMFTNKFPKEKNIKAIIGQYLQSNPPAFKPLAKDSTLAQDLNNEELRRWLVEIRLGNKNSTVLISQDLKRWLNVSKSESTIEENKWEIDFEFPEFPNSEIDVSKEIQKAHKRIQELKTQRQIGQLFLEITTCFHQDQIQKGLQNCQNLQEHYQDNSFIINLGKFKVLELHKDGHKRLKNTLNNAKLSVRTDAQKEVWNYYAAISEWNIVKSPQTQQNRTNLFFDSRNKKYYKLQNLQNYMHHLNIALDIDRKPVYLCSRALGYMLNKQYTNANKDYLQAKKLQYSNDAMQNNILINNLKMQSQINNDELLKDVRYNSLRLVQIQYICNLCKYFKKIKDYQSFQECCLKLMERQPRNIVFKVNYVWALIFKGDYNTAEEELILLKHHKNVDLQTATQLQKQIEKLKAKEAQQIDQDKADQKYENVAKMGKPSATNWYNYAAFLYQKQRQDKYNHAITAVQNAIDLKPKIKFYQLKYVLLTITGNLLEAREMEHLLEDKEGKFGEMRDYIEANM